MEPVTARQLLAAQARVPTGCAAYDAALRGGVRRGQITELAGAAASGKTTLAMQLLVSAVARPGSSAVYIGTEGAFRMDRFEELCEGRVDSLSAASARVSLQTVATADELAFAVHSLPAFVRSRVPPVRLVVVDSVAAPFRGDVDRGNAARRAQELFGMSSRLRALAASAGLAVVTVNQVAAVFEDAVPKFSSGGGGGGGAKRQGSLQRSSLSLPRGAASEPLPYSVRPPVRAALGLAWSNCVNARVLLAHDAHAAMRCPGSTGEGRAMHVLQSSDCAPASAHAVLQSGGLHGPG